MSVSSAVSEKIDETVRAVLGRGVNDAVEEAVAWAVRVRVYRTRMRIDSAFSRVFQPIDLEVYSAVNQAVMAEVARERLALFERDGR